MSRYARLGWMLVLALVIGGCRSESEPPQSPAQKPPTPIAAPSVGGEVSSAMPDAPVAEAPTAESQTPMANAKTPAAADAPLQPNTAQPQSPEAKPSVLGAIGRAFAGVLGVSGQQSPMEEAPAYQPKKKQ